MRKFTMFFMSSLICLCGCFTACSGNSDDNGEEPDNGEVTGPITLTVDKAKIEANGTGQWRNCWKNEKPFLPYVPASVLPLSLMPKSWPDNKYTKFPSF